MVHLICCVYILILVHMATTEEIKALRDETGVSVMQCKKALEEAGGDMEKAKVILRKISASIASKKADRTLGAGVAAGYTHAGGAVVGAVIGEPQGREALGDPVGIGSGRGAAAFAAPLRAIGIWG